jgi:hypothetical protein
MVIEVAVQRIERERDHAPAAHRHVEQRALTDDLILTAHHARQYVRRGARRRSRVGGRRRRRLEA